MIAKARDVCKSIDTWYILGFHIEEGIMRLSYSKTYNFFFFFKTYKTLLWLS